MARVDRQSFRLPGTFTGFHTGPSTVATDKAHQERQILGWLLFERRHLPKEAGLKRLFGRSEGIASQDVLRAPD
ncbi:unnamed protein product [Effrenium voratum]|nr:unnamed protein product [Effrenium voratum]